MRLDQRKKAHLALISKSLIAVALLIMVFMFGGYRLNIETPSFPLGLYKQYSSAPKKGDLIIVCLPQSIATHAKDSEYLSFGICPGSVKPLMKKLVGTQGDTIDISSAGVRVNGVLIPNTAPLGFDHNGQRLERAAGGVLKENQIFVVSDYNPHSWDGRYFGAIDSAGIKGVVKPVFTW